jgi:hypothetical protein
MKAALMKAAARAAEIDKAAAVASRLGLRPSAWTDGDVVVDEVYGESPLFAVWGATSLGAEERVDAAGIPAAVARIRAADRQAERKKGGRRG